MVLLFQVPKPFSETESAVSSETYRIISNYLYLPVKLKNVYFGALRNIRNTWRTMYKCVDPPKPHAVCSSTVLNSFKCSWKGLGFFVLISFNTSLKKGVILSSTFK